jgi:hypothetical protein
VSGFCEHGNELLVSMMGGMLVHLSHYQLLKKDATLWRKIVNQCNTC